jgi:cytochrome c biogenesis protein CcdA
MIKEYLKTKSGKSSMRMFIFILLLLICWFSVLWSIAFIMDLIHDRVNYTESFGGLALILGGGVVSLLAKSIQKKYESDN